MQELLATQTPSAFLVTHSDDSDAATASRASVRGSDASLVLSMEQLLFISHSDVVNNVLVADDPTMYYSHLRKAMKKIFLFLPICFPAKKK